MSEIDEIDSFDEDEFFGIADDGEVGTSDRMDDVDEVNVEKIRERPLI